MHRHATQCRAPFGAAALRWRLRQARAMAGVRMHPGTATAGCKL
jgi:hypothetical protein